ncbi:M20/M25/M40 family metallo-hydrolase [Mesobacillus harenae]|uniref:M20/M25/M40 family metallo-hydrolase n=1 Tax=Mesobacillus harenae TaxID=2213203 RepID=UPI001580311F|nr:M20/M25/M40 family metallo-hydrolase [Mesobacillus harenae]
MTSIKTKLTERLYELVEFESITHSDGEREIDNLIYDKLFALPYFQANPSYLQVHPTEDGRNLLTALVKKNSHAKTVILVSHFDVVDVEEYGQFKDLAFRPKELTDLFYKNKELLPDEIQKEIGAEGWVFGRGTMDMKAGLAIHMEMIEQAISGEFDGNILLLTVPDEEVNSLGMRSAIPVLLRLADEFGLDYQAVLNSEPQFTRYPGDENNYLYTGSIGKVLPGFVCFGREAHVGEPFSGLNATLLSSLLAAKLELNTDFCEQTDDEVSPPPTCLLQMDLKKEYSAKIPQSSATLFNLFLQKKSLDQLIVELLQVAEETARETERLYHLRAQKFAELEKSKSGDVRINVLDYQDLVSYITKQHGSEVIQEIFARAETADLNPRRRSIQIVDELGSMCKELAPMIVLFFAPPYYPPVNSSHDPVIQKTVKELTAYASKQHGVDFKQQQYFGGISDLSYVGLEEPLAFVERFIKNMPVWHRDYWVPFEEMEKFQVPVINVGPLGKDAHQWTERLDVAYSFGPFIDIFERTIKLLLKGDKSVRS